MDNNNPSSTMDYRVGLEKQNKRSDQIIELILDNCRASQITGITDEFVNLEILSLINVGLTTLKGFPKLPKLRRLELSDNRLVGELNLLHGSPKLQHLNLSGNRIKDFEALEPLKEFHQLSNLDLYNCEVTKAEDYRKKVFDLLPKLHSLDGFDRDEREVADTDESDEEDGSNLITRDDNEVDEDEADTYDEAHYDEEDYDGPSGQFDDEDDDDDNDDDDDDDDDDGDDDNDDDADDEEDDEEEDIGQNSSGELDQSREERSLDGEAARVSDDDEVQEVGGSGGHYDNDDDVEDDDDDEDDEDSDLKILQKDNIEEDSDDDDFEPNQDAEDRDHEIDPEDDADEDNGSAQLSTSKMETNEPGVVDSTRGQKRKFDDVGGDEEAEEAE